VEKKLNKLISALKNTEQIFRGMVLDNETEILDANTSQLEIGKNALGNLLDSYVLDSYARFKQGAPFNSKAPFGIPDLKFEGDFYEGFVLYIRKDHFVITSTDEKAFDLEQKYGEEIFGLTEESWEALKPMLIESYIKLFKDELR
jgi:hypothetical protein